MASGYFGMAQKLYPSMRHKVFLSYHHHGDQDFYNAFSTKYHDGYECIFDNSLERKIDSGNAEYVMRSIREKFITGTSCTLVLVGANTWARKYVDWEIYASLEKEHGLIGVNLPTAPVSQGGKIVVPPRLHDNIESGYASWLNWEAIMAGPEQLSSFIAEAKNRSKQLIRNGRDQRSYNG